MAENRTPPFKWPVFEPIGESSWAKIRRVVEDFLQELLRQGALAGSKPEQVYFVKCDAETTTQADFDNGIVNLRVGFAPLKPAEFVVIKTRQLTGDAKA